MTIKKWYFKIRSQKQSLQLLNVLKNSFYVYTYLIILHFVSVIPMYIYTSVKLQIYLQLLSLVMQCQLLFNSFPTCFVKQKTKNRYSMARRPLYDRLISSQKQTCSKFETRSMTIMWGALNTPIQQQSK